MFNFRSLGLPFPGLSLAEQLGDAMGGAALLLVTKLSLSGRQHRSTSKVGFWSAGGRPCLQTSSSHWRDVFFPLAMRHNERRGPRMKASTKHTPHSSPETTKERQGNGQFPFSTRVRKDGV